MTKFSIYSILPYKCIYCVKFDGLVFNNGERRFKVLRNEKRSAKKTYYYVKTAADQQLN